MPLSAGLYKSQDQQEQDLQDGPGWTIDQQKPTFFSDFGVAPALHGVGQGAAEGISVLAKGLQFPGSQSDMEAVMSGPAAGARATRALLTGQREEEPPWHQDWNAGAAELQATTRAFSKTLTADPRTTGAAANLVQGFSKAVTEFVAGSAAGGPLGGAALLGNADAYAHYQDLLDAGVDEATAKRSAILTGATSAAGAVLPMALPAKLLAGLPAVGALLTQVGAGAAINTSFGAASRYASAKILDDAGYHEMAEQQKPWDETNLLTDAITGMFFGAHAGWHGLKNVDAAHVDPAIRDAAKVVQDRQEVNERAPGVPVDMVSAAVHRQALETALGDLMMDKPVDLSEIKTEGATFARPEVDEMHTADIIREEFAKSGVLDDAAAFDRWLAGEKEPAAPKAEESLTTRIYRGEGDEQNASGDWWTSNRAKAEKYAKDGKLYQLDVANETLGKSFAQGHGGKDEYVFGGSDRSIFDKRTEAQPEVPPGALADRPDLQIVNENGEVLHAGDEQQKAIAAEAQANKEAEPMHQTAVDCEARHA